LIPVDNDILNGLNRHALAIYGHELWYLALSVKTRCEAVFRTTHPPENGPYLQVNPSIHAEIFGVLAQAAAIKKLISQPAAKSKGESGRAVKLRRRRAQFFRELLMPLELTEILDVKVRNTIEHFDEYLDDAVIKVSDPATRSSPWAAYNMVLSDWSVFTPRIFPIRVYITSEKTFYNMQWSIDLGKLHSEASSIISLLRSTGKFPDDQQPGGLLIKFEPGEVRKC